MEVAYVYKPRIAIMGFGYHALFVNTISGYIIA